MTTSTAAVLLLLLAAAINVVALGYFWHRGQDGMWLRLILLGNYFGSYVLSGLAHTLGWSRSRGYYEALSGAPVGSESGLWQAATSTLLGLLAIVVGLWYSRPARIPNAGSERSLTVERPALTWMVALVLIAVCGAALLRIRSVVSSLGAERVIAVAEGNARYAFLAAWLPIGIMLLALLLTRRRSTMEAQVKNAAITVVACLAIAFAVSYDGGRANALLGAVPLLALFLPRLQKLRIPLLFAGGVAMSLFVFVQTRIRVGENVPFDFWSLFDWQWGRFSMIAWAERYSAVHGSPGGETFLSGLLAVPDALAHFVDVTLPFGDLQSAVELSGMYLRGSSESIFIVPGYMSELYLNFGTTGIIAGGLALALLTGRLADLFRDSRFEIERLLIATLASIVVFGTLVAQFEAFFQSVLLGALPLWGLWLLERWLLKNRTVFGGDGRAGPTRDVDGAHFVTK